MKRFFYAKIALTNLKKNRQTCFPYLLTCIATIMMFYIMSSLSTNSAPVSYTHLRAHET